MFINRKNELKLLNERTNSDRAEFVAIYGRRRVGKSELIEKFIENKCGIRLLAREETKRMQLAVFSEKLATFFKDGFLAKNPFSTWDGFFEYLIQKSEKRLIIAIDEFPYLVKEDPSLPSILQSYWDGKMKKSKIYLIICGSSISMMERLLGYKSPLYGRRTGQLLIRPFSFSQFLEYESDIKKAIPMFSIFGGTPAYFAEIDKNKNVFENISEKLLREDSFIYKDAEFVIREELREPRYYFSILLSIAKGNTAIGAIMNDTGLERGVVGKYLSILSDLHFVVRTVPVTENARNSKKGLYVLSDNMFKFWFKFVYPYKDLVEKNQQTLILDNYIRPVFDQYISFVFEDICKEALEALNYKKMLPAVFLKIGRQWGKMERALKSANQYEIDIIGLNEKTKEILFAECKWQENVNAGKVIEELKEKAKHVACFNKSRKEYYAVFAKSFSSKITKNNEQNIFYFDLKNIENAFKN